MFSQNDDNYTFVCDWCGKTEVIPVPEKGSDNEFNLAWGMGSQAGWKGWRTAYSPLYSGQQFHFCSVEHKDLWFEQVDSNKRSQ